jgi:hypothetical protein
MAIQAVSRERLTNSNSIRHRSATYSSAWPRRCSRAHLAPEGIRYFFTTSSQTCSRTAFHAVDNSP